MWEKHNNVTTTLFIKHYFRTEEDGGVVQENLITITIQFSPSHHKSSLHLQETVVQQPQGRVGADGLNVSIKFTTLLIMKIDVEENNLLFILRNKYTCNLQ